MAKSASWLRAVLLAATASSAASMIAASSAASMIAPRLLPMSLSLTSKCCCRAPRTSSLRLTAADESLSSDPGAWRIAKSRLQSAWSADIRKRKPRFFSFQHARQWARAMHFETETDWRRWVCDGEKRNPYIPSYPDEVYSESWVSWEDFLNGDVDA